MGDETNRVADFGRFVEVAGPGSGNFHRLSVTEGSLWKQIVAGKVKWENKVLRPTNAKDGSNLVPLRNLVRSGAHAMDGSNLFYDEFAESEQIMALGRSSSRRRVRNKGR